LLACVWLVTQGPISAWVDGPSFRAMLEHETSKGLKLHGTYSSFTRVGWFGLRSDSFAGTGGERAISELHAQAVSGTYDPLGLLLWRWQVDSIHIASGSVLLKQVQPGTAPAPAPPSGPWISRLLPHRVYLTDIQVDQADVLSTVRNQEAGIYQTQLHITPNGRDFEYDAHGGELKSPVSPPLSVIHAHVLVRKPRLYCSELVLGDDPTQPTHGLRIAGDAGLQEDRSMHVTVDLTALKVAPWLTEKMRTHVTGEASGHLTYASTGSGLETAKADGDLVVANGILHELPIVHQYIVVTGSPDPGDLALKTCRANLHWNEGALSADHIDVECERVFHLTGSLAVAADHRLSAQFELGLADPYLRWLPTARTAIFTRDEGIYHFTTVHFSGTAQKPTEDLSPRISHEVAKSPLLALKLFFAQAGEWFDFN
jgi:hypothetical protein